MPRALVRRLGSLATCFLLIALAHAALAEVLPQAAWSDPPSEAKPRARWWWPGGSVEPEILRQQLRQIADAGFGGVELQPLLLGLGAKDLAADPALRSVGEPAFRERVAQAAAAAAEVGLAFDLTLGSGWPGGLPTDPGNAERQLLMTHIDVSGPDPHDGALPPAPDQSYRRAVEWVLDVLGPPDERVRRVGVLAGRVGPERDGIPTLSDLRDIGSHVQPDGTLRWDVPEGDWRVFVLYTNSTGHFVMGSAFPGEERDARVVDHLSRRGADSLIEGYAEPVLAELAPGQLEAVFIDSFELMGELPFTHDFLEAFETRAGYDLRPHLPLVFRRGGESKYGEMMDLFGRTGGPLYVSPEPGRSERIREDYEAVRRALFEERFVGRFVEWARSRDLELRLQAHGGFGDILDTYALADVPESEALFAQGSFDFLKLAASAAHVADRRWASSESFIRLRLLGTRLDEQELRLLAGRAYSAGINRLVYHGVPYPYRRADGRVWFPFSGGFGRILAGPLPMSFHVDAEQLARLPEFNRLLARLSVAMSHGEPVADVAWLHADPSYPDTASLDLGRVDARVGESDATRALRARGLVHDRISRRMLGSARLIGDRREADGIAPGRMDASIGQKPGVQIGARSYRALLLDPLPVAEPVLAKRLAELAEAGVPVLTLGALPERAPGLRDAVGRDARVRSASRRLATRAHPASDAAALETLLARYVPGDLVEPMPDGRLAVSLERRRSREGEILLVVNESWQATRDRLRFSRAGGELVAWDPASGRRETLRAEIAAGDTLAFELGPAECRILTLEAPSIPDR